MSASDRVLAVVEQAVLDLRERTGRVSPQLEQAVQLAITDIKRKSGEQFSRWECDLAIESLFLQQQYADQFVVFNDHWESRDGERRLLRQVLLHSCQWDDVVAYLAGLPPVSRSNVTVEYQPDPLRGAES